MDPTELLEEMRELVEDIFNHEDDPSVLADSLANKVRELDEWLSSGGELPEDWQDGDDY